MDPIPAAAAASHPGRVGAGRGLLSPAAAEHAVAGPLGPDRTQLLDVDVDQLTRAGALVAAPLLLGAQAAELAQAAPLQHRRHRRGRHLQELGDLWAREP